MRVLHFSKYDTRGGASIAALNSVSWQRAAGIDARLVVGRKLSDNPFVMGPEPMATLGSTVSFAIERLPFRMIGVPPVDVRSIGVGGRDIPAIVGRHDPDLVVFHGVDGLVPIGSLSRIERPIVWRMHDMWAAMGTQHYAPDKTSLRGFEAVLDRWTWARKRRAYAATRNLTLCPPSQWLGSIVRRSPLLTDRTCVVIPNGVDTVLFSPGDKQAARAQLGLSPTAAVIAFGATGGTNDPRKGADLLLAALHAGRSFFQRRSVEFLFFGGSGPGQIDGLQFVSAGPITSRERMAEVYRAADLVVVPSRMENLSLTVLEAMACATPVVAFDVGGMPDMITTGVNGWLASEVTSEALLAALEVALPRVTVSRSVADAARRTVEARFSVAHEATTMIELYDALLSGDGARLNASKRQQQ